MPKPRSLGEVVLNVERLWKHAKRQRILIGIPAEKAGRAPVNDENFTPSNAQVGYWHEYGVPEANIPARPFLLPGVELAKPVIIAELKLAMARALEQAVVNGDVSSAKSKIEKGMHRAGFVGVEYVKARITAGLSPPLSPRTVYARLHRKKRRRSGPDMNPLIDSGQLLRSITYVIR